MPLCILFIIWWNKDIVFFPVPYDTLWIRLKHTKLFVCIKIPFSRDLARFYFLVFNVLILFYMLARQVEKIMFKNLFKDFILLTKFLCCLSKDTRKHHSILFSYLYYVKVLCCMRLCVAFVVRSGAVPMAWLLGLHEKDFFYIELLCYILLFSLKFVFIEVMLSVLVTQNKWFNCMISIKSKCW